MASDTFYPDPSPTSTSFDGLAGRAPAPSEDFATIRAGAGNQSRDTNASDYAGIIAASTTADKYDELSAGFFLFDTSSLPDTDTVDSATFSLFGTSKNQGIAGQSIVMTNSAPASNTAIANADYGNRGGTEQASGRITLASWSTTAYNDFTLNSTGLSNVSKTGITKFGTRISSDFDNAAPTWVSGAIGQGSCNYADAAGTANDPKLVVVHSAAAATPVPTLLFMGVG